MRWSVFSDTTDSQEIRKNKFQLGSLTRIAGRTASFNIKNPIHQLHRHQAWHRHGPPALGVRESQPIPIAKSFWPSTKRAAMGTGWNGWPWAPGETGLLRRGPLDPFLITSSAIARADFKYPQANDRARQSTSMRAQTQLAGASDLSTNDCMASHRRPQQRQNNKNNKSNNSQGQIRLQLERLQN